MSNRSSLALSTRTVKIYSGAADAQARAEIAEHVADVANPHDVTAEQVGLGSADNTSDADKPVSTAQAAALAAKAPLASPSLIGTPTAPTAPPGTVSDQVATTAFAQAAANVVGNDTAALSDDLDAHLADHANPHATTKAHVGLALADNTADAVKPVSGPQQAAINAATAIGTAAQADIDGHEANTANPHGVTKSQIGLGSVDNTADLAKPVSAPQQTALNLKAPLASPALTGAPTAPTAAALTSTTQIATTAYAKAAVDAVNASLTGSLALKAPLASPALTGTPTAPTAAIGTSSTQVATTAFADQIGDTLTASLGAHTGNHANPHIVTKSQVGLGNVDNTSDIAKPVSTAQQTAINAAAAIGTAAQADIDGHQLNVSNPHETTKGQIGLGNADNTADLAKPVSAATQNALNLKANLASPALSGVPTAPTAAALTNTTQIATTAYAKGAVDAVNASLTAAMALKAPLASPALTGLPTAPTAAIGTSSAQIATTAFADQIGDTLTASLAAHTANVSNPHAVTKSQVGLGNADNTSDNNKPVSMAQQAAINAAVALKANIASPTFTGIPAAPTAAPGTNTVQLATTAFVGASAATLTAALALKAPLASPALTGVPTAPTATAGTSNTQLATTAFADAIGDALTASLAAHTSNVSNPHSTTKSQVGLGNVDNTSDAAKPVSTATATALALKAPLASPALTGLPTAPTAAPGTATTQLATTAFADAIGDSLRAALDGVANSPERPGDAVALYGTLATGTAAAMPRVDPSWVATSAAGNVLRVNSATADDPQIVAPAGAFGVDSGQTYDVRFRVQRQTDPLDPLNDSVTLAIRWLTNTYAGVAGAGGISTIDNLPLVISNGIVERTARIGGGGLVPPAGAVYFRPYVQLFGNNHVTDLILIDVTHCAAAGVTAITAGTALPAGTSGLVLVSATAPLTVTLPPSPGLGQTIKIKDSNGTAGANHITIAGGGPTIEGAASLVLQHNYSWAELAYNGSQWVQV